MRTTVWPNLVFGEDFLDINRSRIMEQYHSHPSKRTIIDYKALVQLPESYTWANGLVAEYLDTWTQTLVFALILYFTLCTISYLFFFKAGKDTFLPKFEGKLKIAGEIKESCINIFFESFLVAGLRMLIPRFGMVYYDVNDYGYKWLYASVLFHMLWDETLTYWVHRVLHTNRFLYRKLHYIHHKFIQVSPYCGFAFHPLDAFAQAIPTFTSSFVFPIHYDIVLVFSIMTTAWAVSIHDNVPMLPCKLFLYSTHHTIHHEWIGMRRNYGKFTSVWDRLMGSYEDPKRIDYGWQGALWLFRPINSLVEKIPCLCEHKVR